MSRQRFRFGRDVSDTMIFNATPMVDVIFLLTIFFMLVTRFSSAEQIPMQLPTPKHSRARIVHMPERVVINCRPADPAHPDRGTLYSLGPNPPEPLEKMAERLAVWKHDVPNMQAVIRADRRLPYAAVRAVMRVLAENKITMLNVVAHVSEDP